MVLVLESCRTKINQSNVGVEEDSALSGLSVDGGRRRGDPTTVGESLILIIAEKDVFRLQIRMDKVEIV